jgi:hypothetical protein
MDLQDIGWGDFDWTDPGRDRDRWRVIVKAVLKFWVASNEGNFVTGSVTTSFSRERCMVLVKRTRERIWDAIVDRHIDASTVSSQK